jgi:O-antigen ligase
MIIFIMPLVVYRFFSSHRSSERNLSILLFLVNLIAILVTYSRGGAMVLLAVLLLLSIEHLKRFKPKYLGFALGFASLTLIMVLIFVPASYWERLKNVTDVTSISIGRRLSYLSIGWEAFTDNLILGSGPGTFREIYALSDFARMFWTKGDTYRRYAHNSYLEILIGTGILGFAVFIFILWLTLKNFHKAKKHAQLYGLREIAPIVGAYRISFISMLIYFFLISNIYHKYLWLCFGLSQIALNFAQKPDEKPNGFFTHSE